MRCVSYTKAEAFKGFKRLGMPFQPYRSAVKRRQRAVYNVAGRIWQVPTAGFRPAARYRLKLGKLLSGCDNHGHHPAFGLWMLFDLGDFIHFSLDTLQNGQS